MAVGEDVFGIKHQIAKGFQEWKGNCCINWVDGAPYTAKFTTIWGDAIIGENRPRREYIREIYEGHVVATPTDRWRRRNDPAYIVKPPTVTRFPQPVDCETCPKQLPRHRDVKEKS